MTEPAAEPEEAVRKAEITYRPVSDLENLTIMKHLGETYYHYKKDLRDYYYMKEKDDPGTIHFRCTDYNQKEASRTCQALLLLRKEDGHVYLVNEHTCGNTHFFLKGNPVFLPLVPFDEHFSYKPEFLENRIYAFEPNRVNIRHRWRRAVYTKAYFSFVNRRSLAIYPFSPTSSKVIVKIRIRDREGKIVEEKTICNRGVTPEIICVKPVNDADIERIKKGNLMIKSAGSPGSRQSYEKEKKPQLVVAFKIPESTCVGTCDVSVFIANSPFHCHQDCGIEFFKEYSEEEDQGVELLREPNFPINAMHYFCSRFFYGSFFFDKMMKELCAFKNDEKNPIGFVTDEINLRRISRKVKKRFDEFGFNLLIHCAARGFLEIVEVLLEEGFDIEYQDHYGNTALFWAHLGNQAETVEFLLSKGANTKHLNKLGVNYEIMKKRYETALFKRFTKENESIVEETMVNFNTWMEDRIKVLEEHLAEHGHQNITIKQKAMSKKELDATKREVFNFYHGITAKDSRASASKTSTGQTVRGKKIPRPSKRPTAGGGSSKKKSSGSGPSALVLQSLKKRGLRKNPLGMNQVIPPRPLYFYPSNQAFFNYVFSPNNLIFYSGSGGGGSVSDKKKKGAGKKMKKVLIPSWKTEHIIDWLEEIGLVRELKNFFFQQQIKSYKEIEALLTSNQDIFNKNNAPGSERISNRVIKTLLLNIVYLQKCVKKAPKPTFIQTKDLLCKSFYAVLNKILRNPNFSGSSRIEMEDFVSFLIDPIQISETLKLSSFHGPIQQLSTKNGGGSRNTHAMKIYICLTNDYFSYDSFKDWIKQACFHKTLSSLDENVSEEELNRILINSFEYISKEFFAGIILGDVFLQFGRSEIIFPRKIQALERLNCPIYEVTELQVVDYETKYLPQIAQYIVRWNREKRYDKKLSNCYHFVEELLKKALLVREVISKQLNPELYQYFEDLKKTGSKIGLPMELQPILNWNHMHSMNFLRISGESKLMTRFEYVGRKLFGKELIEMTQNDPLVQEMIPDEHEKTGFMVQIRNLFRAQKILNKNYDLNFTLAFKKVKKYLKTIKERSLSIEQFEELFSPMLNPQLFVDRFLSALKKPLKAKDLEIEVLLVQFDCDFEPVLFQEMNSALVHQFSYNTLPTASKDDHFQTAVMIGPYLFGWNQHEIIVPHLIKTPGDMKQIRTFIQSKKVRLPGNINMESLKEKIGALCTEWNGKFLFSGGRATSNQLYKRRNCQEFVDHMLDVLGIWKQVENNEYGPFLEMVDKVRCRGPIPGYFCPGKDFIDYFKLRKNSALEVFRIDSSKEETEGEEEEELVGRDGEGGAGRIVTEGEIRDYGLEYKIVFSSHAMLDEFVNDLFKQANEVLDVLIQRFPSEFRLLKSFDRAYWLKFRKSMGKNDAKYKQTTKVKTGCPFNK